MIVLKKTFYSLPIMIRASERYENLGCMQNARSFEGTDMYIEIERHTFNKAAALYSFSVSKSSKSSNIPNIRWILLQVY